MENNRIIHKERKKDCEINIDYKSMTKEELENTIINSIVISTIGGNNENMNFHCKELTKIERNTEKHTSILINILFTKFINYDKKHQEILIIYIKRWFEKYLYTQGNMENSNLETYIQGLINLIISQNISTKVKGHIKDLLKEFLFYYYNQINSKKNNKNIDNSHFKQFFNNINKLIYEQVENYLIIRNFSNILDYLSIYETLIMRNNMLLYDNETFDKFIVVIELIMNNIKLFYIETQDLEEDRDKNHDYNITRDISNIILSIISDNISSLKNESLAKEIHTYNLFLNNERFIRILKNFLTLNDNFDNVFSNDSIISLKESKSFLNNFKGGLFENLSKANEFIKQHFYYSKCPNYADFIIILYTQTVRALDRIISQSIISEKDEMSWKNIEFNNYISKLLNFLKSCINFGPCEKLFIDNQLEILRLLILPLIRITKLERSYFENEPENYISHILDFANEHQVEGPKSTALFLLEEMCKKLDGFLKFTVYFYIESLYYVVSRSNSSLTFCFTIINNENFLNLNQYLQTLTDEEIIEQSLQVLSMLSCHIFLRKDLIIYYTQALVKLNPILIQINDELLKTKLCLFYSYNLDDLFLDGNNTDQDNFFSSFNFIFNCFTSNNKYITVNLQVITNNNKALDSLNSLLFENSLISVLKSYIKTKMADIYKVFNNYEITKTNMFLELMKGLIKHYLKDLGDEIYIIFNYFWTNFKKELDNNKETKNITFRTRKIYDWINNLKLILSSTHCVKLPIYQEVFPYLTDLIHQFYGCDYEEEIFHILKIINKDIKIIPDKFVGKLEDLIVSLEKNNYHIEKYHLEYIITFLNGLGQNNLIQYQHKIFVFIKKLMFLEHRNISLILSKKYIASSLLFMYIILYRDYLKNNDFVEILDILYSGVTSNLLVQPDYIKRLCDCFMFIVIITHLKGIISEFLKKELKILEILLVKWINSTEKYKNKIESCMSIIFISYIIQFMISDFNENWSALLKSIISSGIDEIIYYKKMLSNEYQKIKDQKNENTDIDIAIIGKKSTDKKNYDENGNEVDVEIINENNDNKLDKFNKLLNGDDNIDYDSDDNEDEEDECEELEESSYSSEENNKDKDKILSRDEVLNKIFEKNNKENRIDDDTFFVKKNINKIEISKIISEFPEVEEFIKKIDEIQLFRETIILLNQKYPKIYNQVINSLSPMKLTLFQKLLELSKLKIEDKTYLRVIKKIKKNN